MRIATINTYKNFWENFLSPTVKPVTNAGTGKALRADCDDIYSMKYGRKGHNAGKHGCAQQAVGEDDWEIVDAPEVEQWTNVILRLEPEI